MPPDDSTSRSGGTDRSRTPGPVPPGPGSRPFVGNTLRFLRDPSRFYESLPAYGDVVRYRVGGKTWTALLHPDDVERVLVSESHRFTRYIFEEFWFDFATEGLLFTDGEQWRRQRQAIQPAFAPAKIAAFSDEAVSETVATVEEWTDGEVISANDAFSELSLEILTTTLFDLDLEDRREVVTAAARATADRFDTQSLSVVLPPWIPTARNRRFKRAIGPFNALVEELIDERRTEDVDREDLLSTLLELSDARRAAAGEGPNGSAAGARLDEATVPGAAAGNGYAFTDEELRDQLVTFLFAGHETTALVLAFAFLLVARHDDVRRRLDEELDAVCGDRTPTVEDVPDLVYTESVIQETMRRYPPVYATFREALEDVTVDGFLIPEGTKVALPQLLLHSDPRWWDDPDEFRPERWTDDGLDEVPEYAYFPFGGGPRHCVGMRFARMVLVLVLATVARQVHFELESDADPDLRMAATLSPASDVVLRVRKRT